jgi:hypothetical protein
MSISTSKWRGHAGYWKYKIPLVKIYTRRLTKLSQWQLAFSYSESSDYDQTTEAPATAVLLSTVMA